MLAGLATILWALFADRARGRRRCPRCWYDLSALPGTLTCPECGRTAASERRLRRTRRRWRRAAAGFLALAVGAGLIATPAVRAHGWEGLVPTTGLILLIPYMDDDPRWFSDALHERTGRDTIPRWQRRLLFNRCGAVLRGSSSREAKRAALRRIESIAWRGGYYGRPTHEAADAAPVLIRAMSDPDPAVRGLAASLLPTVEGDPVASVAALTRVVAEDQDGSVRRSAVLALHDLAEHAAAAVDAVIDASRDEHTPHLRSTALQVLGRLPPETAPRSVPVLIGALASADTNVRHAAVVALGDLGPAAAAGVPVLLVCGKDPESFIARDAAVSLRKVGVRSSEVRQTLFEWLMHTAAEVRQQSLVTIDVLFGSEPQTAARVHGWLAGRDARDAAEAVRTLGRAGRDIGPYAAFLVPMLSDAGPWDRRLEAARLLCIAGYTGTDALEPARALREDRVSSVRVWGLLLAAQIEGDRGLAVEPLIDLLSDPIANTRAEAAEALGVIGPPAAAAIPTLETTLNDTEWTPRERAKRALSAIRGEGWHAPGED